MVESVWALIITWPFRFRSIDFCLLTDFRRNNRLFDRLGRRFDRFLVKFSDGLRSKGTLRRRTNETQRGRMAAAAAAATKVP